MRERGEITPFYVLEKLEEHRRECARRWWAVVAAETTIILTLGTILIHDFMK